MNEVGIITIADYNNYGNRLQAYAIKKVFDDLGFKASTLELNDPYFGLYKARKFKLFLKKYNLLAIVFAYILKKDGWGQARRDFLFEVFTKKFLNVKYFPCFNKRIEKKLLNHYKYFIIGSDQIWHPNVNKTPFLYFGEFIPSEKKIFYAPSFGVSSITKEYAVVVKKGLASNNRLSIREEAGKALLKKVLGIDVDVLVDPTLMLDSDQWDKIAKSPKSFPKDSYILKCFLGTIDKTYENEIKKYTNELKCSVFTLADKKEVNGYITGPCEFISSIKNATLVVTDSFHTLVFSILYRKPFVVFSRLSNKGKIEGLDSRIDDLLFKTGLTDRKFKENTEISLLKCDFRFVDPFLREEREKTYKYLNACIKNKNF